MFFEVALYSHVSDTFLEEKCYLTFHEKSGSVFYERC
jgi:hypothetical protein